MSYVVLARKLRPNRFEDLIGQETISRTLRNAVISGRVAHAFLFSGSRGVGKTSAARILTKALNCLAPEEGNPCGKCGNCIEITENASPDVYEIDAASNRGIENIRELRDNVQYAPAQCRYKVYIIDEAHMLTLESFNALLKTLEEPPSHVKFILATTDPHKLPQTIISRCQRYDFVRVPLQQMADFLEKVTVAEQLSISRRALEIISRQAVGGMRDALTMIDQVLSFTGDSAKDEEVLEILGIVDSDSRFAFLESLIGSRADEAMTHFQNLQDHGHDLHELLAQLLKEVKTLSLIQAVGPESVLFQDYTRDDVLSYTKLAEETTTSRLQQIFDILLDLEERMKRSTHARTCFEMALLQIVSLQPLVGVPELLKEIRKLRKDSGDTTSSETAVESNQQNHSVPDSPSLRDKQEESKPEVEKNNASLVAESTGTKITSMLRDDSRKEVPKTVPPPQEPVAPFEQNPEPAETSAFVEEQQNFSSSDIDTIAEPSQGLSPPPEWVGFAEKIQKRSSILGGLIRNAVPTSWKDGVLKLGFKSGQPSDLVGDENRNNLESLVREFAGPEVQVEWVEGKLDSTLRTLIEEERYLHQQLQQSRREEAESHPLVQEVLKIFTGSSINAVHLSQA